MFISVKNQLKRKKLIRLFMVIVAGTATPAGCGFLAPAEADEVAAAEPTFVEVNKTVTDAAGNVAVRATAVGVAAAAQAALDAAAKAAAAPASTNGAAPLSFSLEKGVPVPEIKRGGGTKADVYPFDKMDIGDSFFIAPSEDRPNPSKSLASTVSSATKRYAEKTGEKETVTIRGKVVTRDKMKFNRQFTVRAVEQNGVKGARIWRTA